MRATVTLEQAKALPVWRQPVTLLVVLAATLPLSFAVWQAVIQNFVVERAGFDGSDWGWMQTVREIPGFLAIAIIVVLWLLREQALAFLSLLVMGAAIAVVPHLPTFQGLLLTTVISSVGFHYHEAVAQSLQLQWIEKDRAPQVLGWILAAGSASSLLAYGLLVVGWKYWGLTYEIVLGAGGAATVLVTLACMALYPRFEAPHPQLKHMVLRRRYWLYYLLQFMAGARRQIFVVFAAFMMVERFGFQVHELTALFMINFIANMMAAPFLGRYVAHFGERNALLIEHGGLILVFLAYGGVYWFGWGVVLAAALYVIDHLFFALSLALRTYFQKIADPADIAPTSAVAFTINHIAAVFLPAALGYLWLVSPGAVFFLAAGMAAVSFLLALLIPRHPEPGRETVFAWRLAPAAAAE